MDLGARLTLREEEIRGLRVQGKRNKEIAHALNISERTVETHLRNLYRKLGVRSALELAHLAGRAERKALDERLEALERAIKPTEPKS